MNFTKIRAFYERFIPLTEGMWRELESRLTVRELKKGEIFINEGERCDYVSFVEEGLLRMYYLKEGKEVSAAFFFSGIYLSVYDSFVTRSPSRVCVDALTDSVLINLDYDSVQTLYRMNPEFEKFGRLIAEAILVSTNKRMMSLMLDDPETRYKNLLKERPKVIQHIPQYMIASYLGVTPEGLSRIKKRIHTNVQDGEK
ncbi:MAG: Crp/Fnr family transcriptional regulator [Ignavibacteriaceae bacterium]|nr:Crp/Fnr family transcriptional regulator [Ignavibacteriaceae bacterium]